MGSLYRRDNVWRVKCYAKPRERCAMGRKKARKCPPFFAKDPFTTQDMLNAEGKLLFEHVLRHPFASRLVMAGVDLRTVQELGGWLSLDLVQRYGHLSATHKAEAVDRIISSPAEAPRLAVRLAGQA